MGTINIDALVTDAVKASDVLRDATDRTEDLTVSLSRAVHAVFAAAPKFKADDLAASMGRGKGDVSKYRAAGRILSLGTWTDVEARNIWRVVNASPLAVKGDRSQLVKAGTKTAANKALKAPKPVGKKREATGTRDKVVENFGQSVLEAVTVAVGNVDKFTADDWSNIETAMAALESLQTEYAAQVA